MNYVGVDIHKKYSVLCALDESGRKLREGRVAGNAPEGFAQFLGSIRDRLGTAAVKQKALNLCQELFLADGVRSEEEDAVLQNLRALLE